jgi:hypothetical protein
MEQENRIVHGLWIGSKLSLVELLCMHSFLEMGHEFHLWVYETPETPVPANVTLRNANEIIDQKEVFSYHHKNQFGHGKGSYAGFSDLFRYRLLSLHGGWWTDMDVVCLKPLDLNDPYVFRTHHDFPLVGNIMKCPAGSALMQRCFDRAIKEVDAHNTDWNLPIRILNEEISELELTAYIREFSNQDSWRYVRNLMYRNPRIPDHWYVLHLVNEEWRRNKINKNAIPRFSFIGRKLSHYKIVTEASSIEVFRNYFRIVFPRSFLIQAYWLAARTFWKAVRLVKPEKPQKKN